MSTLRMLTHQRWREKQGCSVPPLGAACHRPAPFGCGVAAGALLSHPSAPLLTAGPRPRHTAPPRFCSCGRLLVGRSAGWCCHHGYSGAANSVRAAPELSGGAVDHLLHSRLLLRPPRSFRSGCHSCPDLWTARRGPGDEPAAVLPPPPRLPPGSRRRRFAPAALPRRLPIAPPRASPSCWEMRRRGR